MLQQRSNCLVHKYITRKKRRKNKKIGRSSGDQAEREGRRIKAEECIYRRSSRHIYTKEFYIYDLPPFASISREGVWLRLLVLW